MIVIISQEQGCSMPQIKFYLFGLPRIEVDDNLTDIHRHKKGIALLAYLAVTGGSHERNELADLLWPDYDKARNYLRNTIYGLKKNEFIKEWLITDQETISLNRSADFWLDVNRFLHHLNNPTHNPSNQIHHLTEAVKLYTDDFLAGFTIRDNCFDFERWRDRQEQDLRQASSIALGRLVEIYWDRHQRDLAFTYARRRLVVDPLNEEVHQRLMRLYYDTGQFTLALRQYDECRKIIRQKLDVEVGDETTKLYKGIKDRNIPSTPFFTASSPPPAPAPQPKPFESAVVARDKELERLDQFLNRAVNAHEGRIIFVTGASGSGKTALVQEFARRSLEAYTDLVIAGSKCNSYAGDSTPPYLPFREILRSLTGDTEVWRTRVDIHQPIYLRLQNLIPHSVKALLSVAPDLIDDDFVPGPALVNRVQEIMGSDASLLTRLKRTVADKMANRGPTIIQQRDIFTQYTNVLEMLTRQQPLLLILDDLQWADLASLNLLFPLAQRLMNHRIFIIGIYESADVAQGRGGQRHPLLRVVNELQSFFGDIHINLKRALGEKFIKAILATEPNLLGVEFREALLKLTNGHPQFTVEILRSMEMRRDLKQDEDGNWVEAPQLDWETLPPRVEGVIAEHISQLPEELLKLLKVASIEGEEFLAEVIAQVHNVDELEIINQLSSDLDKRYGMVQEKISDRLGDQRLSFYQFRHHLFQRYIYNRLGKIEKSILHERVGFILERLYAGRPEEIALQLAKHFREARITAKVVTYLSQAGKQALKLSANEEAIVHFNEALSLLKGLPDTPERVRQELDLQISLGPALIATKGYAAPEVEQVYTRARELSQQIEDSPQVYKVLLGSWLYYFVRDEFQTAQELGKEFLQLAQRGQDPAPLLQARRAMGNTLCVLGEFTSAQEHFEAGIDASQRLTSRDALLYDHDPGVTCLSYSSLVLWVLGYPNQALKRSQEALTLARKLDHPFTLAFAYSFAALFHHLCREEQAIQEKAEIAFEISTKKGFIQWEAYSKMLRAWALAQMGQEENRIEEIQEALAGWQRTGAKLGWPYYLLLLAETYKKTGQIEHGLTTLTEALTTADNSGDRWPQAELYRLKGELLLEDKADEEAELCFHKALEIARKQQAKSWELRVVMSLSRLLRNQDRQEEARQLLAEIYNWFTEGFDTSDLKEAKALLEELS